MILLVTNKRDITTDFIVLELQRREQPYFRLNTEMLPASRMVFDPRTRALEFHFGDTEFSTTQVSSAYFRRPGAPIVNEVVRDSSHRDYCTSEWRALLKSLYGCLADRWFNAPHSIVLAEDKPRQLGCAIQVGFAVPETIITNDPDELTGLMRDGEFVIKPLRNALLEESNLVIFTSSLPKLNEDQREGVSAAPIIVQREIKKQFDVRVTVVKDRVFATSIDSQSNEETLVDWRRGSNPVLKHKVLELPDSVAGKCVEITRNMGLSFGAIDLVLDPDGQYWFLEINPNGQWAWIENRTKQPIAAAIVDELLAHGKGN